ncbi:hypothetical protein [Caldimonas brevitalea]|nr:hypothetical protein [Caldimonas brevitalea]
MLVVAAVVLTLGGLAAWRLWGPPAASPEIGTASIGTTVSPAVAGATALSATEAGPGGARPAGLASAGAMPTATPVGGRRGTGVEPDKLFVGDNPEYPTLATRMTEMTARRDGEPVDPEQALAAMQQAAAWTADPSVASQLKLSASEMTDGRSFVRFNPMKLETLMPGDTLAIPVQHTNATYKMQIENVTAHGDGSITWSGRLKDFSSENQASITQSKGVTIGGFSTPDGPHVLEVRGDKGWIVPSGTLFKPTGDDHDRTGVHPMGPGHDPHTDPIVLR